VFDLKMMSPGIDISKPVREEKKVRERKREEARAEEFVPDSKFPSSAWRWSV